MGEESIEELQAKIAALKAKIGEAEGRPAVPAGPEPAVSPSPPSSGVRGEAPFAPKVAVGRVDAAVDPRRAAIQSDRPEGADVVPTPLRVQNADVDYSFARDGSLYYTDKLEKNREVWEKPAWAKGNAPLRTLERTEKVRSGEDLARPITFFNGRDASESAEANGMIVNLSGSSGNRIQPVESKIEWEKPAWTEKVKLRHINSPYSVRPNGKSSK